MTDEEIPYHEIDAIEEVMNALVDIHEKASHIEIRDRARAAYHIMSAARDYSTIAESFGDCEAAEEAAG